MGLIIKATGRLYKTELGWRWTVTLPNNTSHTSDIFYTRRWSAWRGMRRFMRQVQHDREAP